MSADNAYAIFEKDSEWYFCHVFMSPFEEDCMYLADVETDNLTSFENEDKAVLAAYHEEQKEIADSGYGTEYGIFSAGIPEKPCGTCYVCVNDRNIIDEENVTRCDDCGNVITGIMMSNHKGTFCGTCRFRNDILIVPPNDH